MSKQNGGIIGPDNVTTGGFSGVASGVFKLGEVTKLIRESKWPQVSPFPTNVTPNSARFNNASNDELIRSKGASETSTRKATYSFWIKRAEAEGTDMWIYSNEVANDNNRGYIQFNTDSDFRIIGGEGADTQIYFITNAKFLDVSAWSHWVVAIDSTQGTQTDRVKIYHNGVQVTSFSQATYPSQNADLTILVGGQTNKEHIGNIHGSTARLSAYLSEFVFVDGTQLTPTSFGEFNSDSGIWIPKAITGLTFGNEGYYLKFTNASALGEDFSGEDNDFSVSNLTSLDQSTDSPSNNFSTLNPLNVNPANSNTFADGNLKATLNGEGTTSTMAMSSGSWYMEYKCTGNITQWTGVEEINSLISLQYSSGNASVALYVGGATMYVNGSNQGSGGYGSGWSSGDIGMIAFDADLARVYFGKNGGWWNGSSYGAAAPSTYVTATTGKTYYFRFVKGGNTNTVYEVNFGNPSFAISSGNADANGFGNFEYAVPSGFVSLCTNNLNLLG